MQRVENPATQAFAQLLSSEILFGQVLVRPGPSGFELRHVSDRDKPAAALRAVSTVELRALSQFSKEGFFRPLKAAPTLVAGWRLDLLDGASVVDALQLIYPASVIDWHSALTEPVPVCHFRDFTNRQTGMYRITQTLGDGEAAATIRSCCHESSCLKRRLWTVDGLQVDPESKGLIPCLEPCAVFLEFARKSAKMDREEPVAVRLCQDELKTLAVALETAALSQGHLERDADVASPENPRRIRLLLSKITSRLGSQVTNAD